MESALTALRDQLSEAGERSQRLEQEFAAFRARRSVRAAVAIADAAYAGARRRSWLKRITAHGNSLSDVFEPPSPSDARPVAAVATGRWEARYAGVEAAQPYGDTVTYQVGAEFLAKCDTVEDWGCGLGWMRNFVPADRYIGVDGSASRFADRVADLETYRSHADGIFMRHVLEHNYQWEKILENALASFRRRFVLVTFTPYGETTREIAFHEDPGVPDISFAKEDLTNRFDGLTWREETFATDTQYGTETIYLIEKPAHAPDDTSRSAPRTLKISAVVPCFNGTAYLEEALSSIRDQTRRVHEIIVVDDGSTDGSAELAERCGATVIRHGVNRGEGAARNTGWRAATGDAIAWLDADDSWRPNHLEVVGALLERHPEAACAFGAVQRFGLDDQLITGLVPPGEPCELLREAFQSWLHASIGCIMRRAALEAVGGYDEQERISVDFDLWLRLARHNRFVATHEVTANWRWHEAQQSAAPLTQILAVHRYRRRFLKALRDDGEHALAGELETLIRPSWTAHLNGVRETVEHRRTRHLQSLGQPYRGPTFVEQARWAALSRLHPSVIDVIWHLAGRA